MPDDVASVPVRPRRFGWWAVTLWIVLGLFVAPILISAAHLALKERPHWSRASHVSTGQAPDPATTPEPVVQVYAARTWGLRGSLAVHTWISSKRANADHYIRHEIIGWHLYRGGTALVRGPGRPDAMWFSNYPELLVDLRGQDVEDVIDKVEAAAAAYPYAATYRTWPGPNSNTFTAFVGRQVPELGIDLPPTAVGKDYLTNGGRHRTVPQRDGIPGFALGARGRHGCAEGGNRTEPSRAGRGDRFSALRAQVAGSRAARSEVGQGRGSPARPPAAPGCRDGDHAVAGDGGVLVRASDLPALARRRRCLSPCLPLSRTTASRRADLSRPFAIVKSPGMGISQAKSYPWLLQAPSGAACAPRGMIEKIRGNFVIVSRHSRPASGRSRHARSRQPPSRTDGPP